MDINQLNQTTKISIINESKCIVCSRELEAVNVMLLYKGLKDSRWQKERILYCSSCNRYYILENKLDDFKKKYRDYLALSKHDKKLDIISNLKINVLDKGYRHSSCNKNTTFDRYVSEKVILEDADGNYNTISLNKCPTCNEYFVRKSEVKSLRKKVKNLQIKHLSNNNSLYQKNSNSIPDARRLNVVYDNKCINEHDCYEQKFGVNFKIDGNTLVKKTLTGYYCNDCEMFIVDFDQYDEIAGDKIPNCDLYVNYKQFKKELPSKKNINNDNIPKKADFFVRTNVIKCIRLQHTITNIVAEVNVIDSLGNVSIIEIPAYYCKSCNLFFIYNSEFDKLRRYGVPLCPIYEYDKYINNKSKYSNLNQESLLHSFGYNVGSTENLSDVQRRKILKFVIENGIMNKHEIISLLNYFINNRRGNLSMSNAIKKWESDVTYLKQDSFRISQHVKVSSITIKRNI